jgi:hypothetical protein
MLKENLQNCNRSINYRLLLAIRENTKNIFLIVALVSITTSGIVFNNTNNTDAKKSHVGADYGAGHVDGCADQASGTSNALNGHSNANSHSAAYLAGYDAGLTNCDGSIVLTDHSNDNQNSGNVDQNNRVQPTSQQATAAQHCFVLIGSCSGANVNQGADLTN